MMAQNAMLKLREIAHRITADHFLEPVEVLGPLAL
jgi:hypothetical protein